MITIATIMALPQSFSLMSVALIALCSAGLGFLLKMGVLAKSRSRSLKLEDEMLTNHSRILTLEKKISQLEKEKKEMTGSQEMNSIREKKISLERKVS